MCRGTIFLHIYRGPTYSFAEDYPSKPHFYGSPLQSYTDISPSPFKRFRPIKSRLTLIEAMTHKKWGLEAVI